MAHITFVHGIGNKPAPDDFPAQRSQRTGQAPYPSRALFTDEPTQRDRQRQRRSVARRGVGQRLRLRGERHVRKADLVDDDVASSRLRLVDTINNDVDMSPVVWRLVRHTNTDGISLNFPHHDNGVLRHVHTTAVAVISCGPGKVLCGPEEQDTLQRLMSFPDEQVWQ